MNLTQNLILLFSRFGNSLKLSQLPSLGTHIITLNKAKYTSLIDAICVSVFLLRIYLSGEGSEKDFEKIEFKE